MEISRRGFLSMSGAIGSGVALSSLGLDLTALKAHAAELSKMDRIRTAKQIDHASAATVRWAAV